MAEREPSKVAKDVTEAQNHLDSKLPVLIAFLSRTNSHIFNNYDSTNVRTLKATQTPNLGLLTPATSQSAEFFNPENTYSAAKVGTQWESSLCEGRSTPSWSADTGLGPGSGDL